MDSHGRGIPTQPGAASPALTFKEAFGVFEKKDYEKALPAFLALAEGGHPRACCLVGYMHAHGLGCCPDLIQATAWYRRGAEAGDSQAQRFFAWALEEGKGVSVDLGAAFRWMRRAALQSDPVAQNVLGYYYANGLGVPEDMAEAYYWCALSARAGNQNAVKCLEGRVPHCMTTEEVVLGHRLLWEHATPPLSEEHFFVIVAALHRKITRMRELEDESRKSRSEWAFTHKMEKECYAESLWIFVKVIDNLNPRELWEGPGTLLSMTPKQRGGAS